MVVGGYGGRHTTTRVELFDVYGDRWWVGSTSQWHGVSLWQVSQRLPSGCLPACQYLCQYRWLYTHPFILLLCFFLLLLLVVLTSGLMLQEHFYWAQLLQERSERVRRLGVTQRRRVHTSLKVVESSPRDFVLDGISRCLTYFLLCTIVATADNSNCQQYFRLLCSFRNCMFY